MASSQLRQTIDRINSRSGRTSKGYDTLTEESVKFATKPDQSCRLMGTITLAPRGVRALLRYQCRRSEAGLLKH